MEIRDFISPCSWGFQMNYVRFARIRKTIAVSHAKIIEIPLRIAPLLTSSRSPRFISGIYAGWIREWERVGLLASNKDRDDAGTEGRKRKTRELCALPLMGRNKGQKRKNGNKRGGGGRKKRKIRHRNARRNVITYILESGANRACRGINSRVLEQSCIVVRAWTLRGDAPGRTVLCNSSGNERCRQPRRGECESRRNLATLWKKYGICRCCAMCTVPVICTRLVSCFIRALRLKYT